MAGADQILPRVRTALRTRLVGLPWVVAAGTAPVVAWEGVVWPPPDAPDWARKPYLREQLKPNVHQTFGLGAAKPVRTSGLYLVDVFLPQAAAESLGLGDDITGQVLVRFAADTILVQDGTAVTVRKVYPSPPVLSPPWVQRPVTVEWFADAINAV